MTAAIHLECGPGRLHTIRGLASELRWTAAQLDRFLQALFGCKLDGIRSARRAGLVIEALTQVRDRKAHAETQRTQRTEQCGTGVSLVIRSQS